MKQGFGFYILILLILAATVVILMQSNPAKELTYSEVIDYFTNEQVTEFVTKDGVLNAKLKDGTTITYTLADEDLFWTQMYDTIQDQHERGIITSYDPQRTELPWWMSIVPYVVMLVIFGLFWYFMFSKQDGGGRGAMQFGKARAKLAGDDKRKVTFDDVAGADEEKAELQEIVEFLRNPRKFTEIGARIPKGVLLVGPPGTGKTLIARAVAGEAGVPFLSISGSDFVELYVGVGASRVRDLFDQAKKNSPAIIFIDEIDAVGRHRGAGLGGGHDEREQTLNQLLVEMDGFGANEGVIIIAATNRPDILDPALLRPGRFDRQVYVGAPDIKGREAILKVHAKGKNIDPSVSFDSIAKSTSGFTGADLENLLNEAALLAARRGKKTITMDEIEDSFLKVIMGTEKKSRVMSEKEKRLTAYHEAGHAVVTRLLPTQDPVHQISIVPRGRAGGFTMSLPQEDKFYATRNEMRENIITLLGGRVAEALTMDDISTGASNDIERATQIASAMVTQYGMSDRIGPINYGSNQGEVFLGRDFTTSDTISEKVSAEIDAEVKAIITEAYARCEQLLRDHMEQLTNVAEYLIRNETMDGESFEKMFNGEEVPDRVSGEKAFRLPTYGKVIEPDEKKVPNDAAPEAEDVNAPEETADATQIIPPIPPMDAPVDPDATQVIPHADAPADPDATQVIPPVGGEEDDD
ncbi:MAG: ATP-dependent zinc metalloprotease FtsH [Butyricicoccaceae bacterium]